MSLSGRDWIETVVNENFATTALGEAVASGELSAFLWDDGLECVAANDAACALTGYSVEELLRLSVLELVVAPDAELLLAARELASGGVWNGTWRVLCKDGHSLDVTFVNEAARIGGRAGYILTLCWPPNAGRTWTLREQAALQITRATARRR